ncbi:MAG: hypothetical protein NWE91_08445 [Candidatus Bathyarchaeota archaeon]|nr:hypothetical protein [Candidatus Bathyarchaeota archaeon]
MKKKNFQILLTFLLVGALTSASNVPSVSAEYVHVDLSYLATHPEEFLGILIQTTGMVRLDVFKIPEQPGNVFLEASDSPWVGMWVYIEPYMIPLNGSIITIYGAVLYGMMGYYVHVQSWVYAPKLLLETDKHIYKLGENITITLTNIGSATVTIGGYPAWYIFTYPEEQQILATFYSFLAWSLEPGESDSFTWDQYDLSTYDYVNPGTYIIKDTQEWGLTTYFKIVDAKIIVPDDYPTIQEAINNANEGDSIFARNGTYYENVVVNKSISLLGEDRENTVIDGGGAGTVIQVDSDNVTISGFEIRNCSMAWGDWGIALNYSSKSVISGNIVKAVYAILVEGGSDNSVKDNDVVGYDGSCVFHGLQLVNSSGNVVSDNNLSSDCHSALVMHNSSNNIISFNYMSGHFVPFYFTMEKSSNNSIVGNTMWQPAPLFGGHIYFIESKCNVLYHNSFLVDEGPNIMSIDELSTNNTWDNGCEGNFWSDYNGTDLNGDGVGDTYLPWKGVDNYPLMNLYWSPGDVNHDLKVDIYDVVLACSAYSSTPSDPNWNCHCDIAEPHGIIDIYDIVMICSSYGEEYLP